MELTKKRLRKIIRRAYNQGAVDVATVFRPDVVGVSSETQISPEAIDLYDRARNVKFGFVRNEVNRGLE